MDPWRSIFLCLWSGGTGSIILGSFPGKGQHFFKDFVTVQFFLAFLASLRSFIVSGRWQWGCHPWSFDHSDMIIGICSSSCVGQLHLVPVWGVGFAAIMLLSCWKAVLEAVLGSVWCWIPSGSFWLLAISLLIFKDVSTVFYLFEWQNYRWKRGGKREISHLHLHS